MRSCFLSKFSLLLAYIVAFCGILGAFWVEDIMQLDSDKLILYEGRVKM
ncbi:hypothetical protein KL86SPO_31406 [uncultured Sporomusa sp.]|uniref:Uncharacterized protein n=1 Tax=uncultured Sporomusa sp. TaxID=307249 RepID=A0A212LUT5_9FIRM|nr:hypothetical protein KL86SPO_31406 [uncultured Sporomusa sp.]